MSWLRQEQSTLNDYFFSKENLDTIQKQLIDTTNSNTGKRICRQSDIDVSGIMQWVYSTYSLNGTSQDQVPQLNSMVVQQIMPMIISGLRAQEHYINDIGKVPVPQDINIPKITRNDKSLELQNRGDL
jgi:hypothetical protein